MSGRHSTSNTFLVGSDQSLVKSVMLNMNDKMAANRTRRTHMLKTPAMVDSALVLGASAGTLTINGAKNQAMMQMYMQEQSTRPQTRVKSTRGPQNRSQSRATSRPHTVATTRTHKTHYYYGKPPPKEAHAAVLNLSRTQEIKAPIIERRLRSRESTKTEDAKQPHISVLQPYPMNYNTFLVQTLFKDMSKLYPDPDNIIKSGVEGEEVLVEDGGVQVVDSRFCWKMT